MRADRARTEIYGEYLDDSNLFMPIGHLQPIMQEASNNNMRYRGLHINQHPCDAWVIQEIIQETQPELIIEIGSGFGGSTAWLRDLLQVLVGPGSIISIDIDEPKVKHWYVEYFIGDSESIEIINKIKSFINLCTPIPKTMIIDDCSHSFDNVLANLKNYGPMVTKDCYYIVEDTRLNNKAPMKAIQEYLNKNDDFEIDRTREKFFITACPNGFLRKVK